MNAWPSFIAAPSSRRGRPPMNLTDEQRTERRRIQWAARYQRVKKQKEEEEATRRDSNTDTQRTLRHSPSHSNTPLAADQPLDSGSQVSGAVHGLALRQKSDDSEVRWVKSLTPENYTATASLVNVRGQCLNASLVVAPRREQSLAPSTAFNHSGGGASLGAWSSQRTSTYAGGPLLQSVETAIRQTQPVIGQDDAYPAEARREVRLPPTAELDPLFRWLSDFTLYDNDDPRSLQPSHNSATLLSVPDESVRRAESTEAAAALRSQERPSSAATLSVEEDELGTLDQMVNPETIELRRSATDFLLSQMERPTHVEEQREAITDGDSRPSLSLAQVAERIQSANIPDVLAQPALLDRPCGQDTDWEMLLIGGEQVPILEMAQSHRQASLTQAIWDVDSILARLACLSACNGIRFSFCPKITWNMKGDLRVSIQGGVLHKTPHPSVPIGILRTVSVK